VVTTPQSGLPLAIEGNSELTLAKKSMAPATQVLEQKSEVKTLEVQKLALPKDMGVIRPASSVPVMDSRVTLVHVAPEVQMLVLPKDMGVIRPASTAPTVPVIDSRVKLVQVAPNVYEIHAQQQNVIPIKVADTADIPSTEKLRVEVTNGNGVTGMAGQVGRFLHSQGYPAVRLTNHKPFQVRMTQIFYRDGHLAEAQHLKLCLFGTPEMVQRDDMRSDIGVRLVLGKDMVPHLAHFDEHGGGQAKRHGGQKLVRDSEQRPEAIDAAERIDDALVKKISPAPHDQGAG